MRGGIRKNKMSIFASSISSVFATSAGSAEKLFFFDAVDIFERF